MPLAKWLAIESQLKHHVCSSYPTNLYMEQPSHGDTWESQNSIWAGNIADQNCAESTDNLACQDYTHFYDETDMDYYVACAYYTPVLVNNTSVAAWAGVGGTSNQYSNQSAELILERVQSTTRGINNGAFNNADTTFYGAGVTDEFSNPTYRAYNTTQHDYANAYLDGYLSTDKVLNTGSINYDAGDVPYDEYTINVDYLCGGYSTC